MPISDIVPLDRNPLGRELPIPQSALLVASYKAQGVQVERQVSLAQLLAGYTPGGSASPTPGPIILADDGNLYEIVLVSVEGGLVMDFRLVTGPTSIRIVADDGQAYDVKLVTREGGLVLDWTPA